MFQTRNLYTGIDNELVTGIVLLNRFWGDKKNVIASVTAGQLDLIRFGINGIRKIHIYGGNLIRYETGFRLDRRLEGSPRKSKQ